MGTYHLLLLVHFKSVRFDFPVTVRSFKEGSPVYSLTFGEDYIDDLRTNPPMIFVKYYI